MNTMTKRMDGPEITLPIGALLTNGGAYFRVWARNAKQVEIVFTENGEIVPMTESENGYFVATVPGMAAGALYQYRLNGDSRFPDPASRYQPDGPHGPSMLVDSTSYAWNDAGWRGIELRGQVFYEMHIGTFTAEGTWRAAAEKLPALRDVGITSIVMMPVADFPGNFNWGYDGVCLFAPTRLYGTPDDLRFFIDTAHQNGLGVLLDVVYNHFGPEGNYLRNFSDSYFTDRYKNEWGQAINFDGTDAKPVREFFLNNTRLWIGEYRFDGFRFDATQQIFDASEPHILTEIAEVGRQTAGDREVLFVCENETQTANLVRAKEVGGNGLDALLNDDFHHSAIVALTGRNEAYYSDYLGTAQELVSAARWGFLYQGQWSAWQAQPRGTPSMDIIPERFVNFLENHDQVANSARGHRLHQRTSPGRFRAMTALLLLLPGTPFLFQGQEFSASNPFLYFADHPEELARLVRAGRQEFLSQFPSLDNQQSSSALSDPADRRTFEQSKLSDRERYENVEALNLHRDLLHIRKVDAVFSLQRRIDGEVLRDQAFILRFYGETEDRLLLLNLGSGFELTRMPIPLLAPLKGRSWILQWSSEDFSYGGSGTVLPSSEHWFISGESAFVLKPSAESTLNQTGGKSWAR